MPPTELTYFAVTLFLALAALIAWKRRRDIAAARVNKGLRGYAAKVNVKTQETADESQGEQLIPA